MPHRVVVTDYSFPSLDIEEGVLASSGCEIIGRKAAGSERELCDLVSGADCVITQFAPVNAAVIASMNRAKAIVRYGIGVDNVDLAAARGQGIPVCNVPAYCIAEVSDHTLGLILSLTRGLAQNGRLIRDGGWGLAVPLERMSALGDLTVGVVGFGRLGRAVAARLLAFGAAVLVFDPQVSASDCEAAGCARADLEELLRRSDVVTLHCPSMAETRGMINERTLGLMKRGALLINTARGDLVVTSAMIEALTDGRLGGAGLDVSSPEPIEADSPLRRLDNVIFTSHIASASVRAVMRLRTTAAELALAAVRGETLRNVVNGVHANRKIESREPA